ncbi:hypothetical protein H4R35_000180 [Dimargaris xerosporica]|nr:hypothetical protein H4R35_000180 [Dimargaris xerosporica]
MQISTIYLAALMAATVSVGVLARPTGYATTQPAYPSTTPAYQDAAPVDCTGSEGSYVEVVEPEDESCDDATGDDSGYAGEAPATDIPADNADTEADKGSHVPSDDQDERYERSNDYTDEPGQAAPEATSAYSGAGSDYLASGGGGYEGNDHSGEQNPGNEEANGYGDDTAPESTPAYADAGDEYPLETPATSGPHEGDDTDGNYGSEQPANGHPTYSHEGQYDACEEVSAADDQGYTVDAPEHNDGEPTDSPTADPSDDSVGGDYHAEAPETGYSAQPAEAQPEQSGGYKVKAY